MLEPDADELGEIFRMQPDRQAAQIDGRVGDIADAQASHAQAVLVGIHRSERFAERLADAVAQIRAHRRVDADAAAARIESDGMIGGREDDRA